MALLALGTWWLVKNTPSRRRPSRSDRSAGGEPDYTMQQLRGAALRCRRPRCACSSRAASCATSRTTTASRSTSVQLRADRARRPRHAGAPRAARSATATAPSCSCWAAPRSPAPTASGEPVRDPQRVPARLPRRPSACAPTCRCRCAGPQPAARRRAGLRRRGAQLAGARAAPVRAVLHRAATDDATAPLVFITGASSGIGQALAPRYADAGWRLALVARRAPMRRRPGPRRRGWTRRAARSTAPMSPTSTASSPPARPASPRQGLPDVVIANAGISVGMDTAERDDLDVMRDTLATNNARPGGDLPPLRRRHARSAAAGTLVGIASVAAIRGLPGHGAYCASKAAVVAYCESLRGECRASGVRVVTLLPGYIATPLTAKNPLSDALPDAAGGLRRPRLPRHRGGRQLPRHPVADGRSWPSCCAPCPTRCSTACSPAAAASRGAARRRRDRRRRLVLPARRVRAPGRAATCACPRRCTRRCRSTCCWPSA